jgi:hypothetical protein
MDMSVDFLKNVGAGIVAAFRTGGPEGVTLNEGIIKAASANQLNADQVARLVETVNQLAYLSGPHSSMNKTAEFPLADYEQVISAIIAPPSIEKAASARRPSPLSLLAEPMEKVASEADHQFQLDPAEAHKQAERAFYAGRDQLKRMDVEEVNIVEGLQKAAAAVKSDPDALNKIAALAGGDNRKYGELCNLVFGHVKEASRSPVRNQADLLNVQELANQLGLAKQASTERKNLEERLTKLAGEICPAGMDKEAFIGSLVRAAGTVLRGAKPGLANAGKSVKLGGTIAVAAPEVSQISRTSAPKNDIWSSLHS